MCQKSKNMGSSFSAAYYDLSDQLKWFFLTNETLLLLTPTVKIDHFETGAPSRNTSTIT